MRSPPPPSGYSIRPATWGDLGTVANLMAEAERADTGSVETTANLLRVDWEDPNFDLARDAWIVFPGRTVEGPAGYAHVFALDRHRQLEGWAIVHPTHRGRGIGSFLSDVLEARALQHVPQAPPETPIVLRDGTVAQDRAGHDLLEERGFTPIRHFWRMEAPLHDGMPEPADIPGIRLRTFALGRDDRGVHRAIQETFADHWGFVARGFDEWAAHRLHGSGFEPDLWWVAEEGDEIVATLTGSVADGIAWVGMLGVRAPWRKRGIGEALLRHSFRQFRRRGLERVRLGVDAANETGATALYERVGMHVSHQFDVYEKRLR